MVPDDYVREQVLGRGSMGSVYLVRRRTDGLRLALKTVAIASSRDRELAQNEIGILRSLEHPHIVRFIDSFVADEELCIAMELCLGSDLAALITRQREVGKRLPEVELRSMLAQLVAALAHVHARRIVHRDIKSSNIFLRDQPVAGGSNQSASGGGRHHLLVGDFGVAKALESTKAMACTQCGTPYYLPPEVCNGSPYDVRADLWSLGVLAYEMCALRYPFAGQTLPQLIMKIMGGKYTALPSSLSPEIRNLVSSLLQQRPQHRPSAESLLQTPALAAACSLLHPGSRPSGSSAASPPDLHAPAPGASGASTPVSGASTPLSSAPSRPGPPGGGGGGRQPGDPAFRAAPQVGVKRRKDALPPEAKGGGRKPTERPAKDADGPLASGRHPSAAAASAAAAAAVYLPVEHASARRGREGGVPDAKELLAEHRARKAMVGAKRPTVLGYGYPPAAPAAASLAAAGSAPLRPAEVVQGAPPAAESAAAPRQLRASDAPRAAATAGRALADVMIADSLVADGAPSDRTPSDAASTYQSTAASERARQDGAARQAAAAAGVADADRAKWDVGATQLREEVVGQIRGAAFASDSAVSSQLARTGTSLPTSSVGSSTGSNGEQQLQQTGGKHSATSALHRAASRLQARVRGINSRRATAAAAAAAEAMYRSSLAVQAAAKSTAVGVRCANAADGSAASSPAAVRTPTALGDASLADEVIPARRSSSWLHEESSTEMKLRPSDRLHHLRTDSWKDLNVGDSLTRDRPGREFSSSFSDYHPSRIPRPSKEQVAAAIANVGGCNGRGGGGSVLGHLGESEARQPVAAAADGDGAADATTLKLEEVSADLSSLFTQFDSNGDGRLDVQEFQQLMMHMMAQGRATSPQPHPQQQRIPTTTPPPPPPAASTVAAPASSSSRRDEQPLSCADPTCGDDSAPPLREVPNLDFLTGGFSSRAASRAAAKSMMASQGGDGSAGGGGGRAVVGGVTYHGAMLAAEGSAGSAVAEDEPTFGDAPAEAEATTAAAQARAQTGGGFGHVAVEEETSEPEAVPTPSPEWVSHLLNQHWVPSPEATGLDLGSIELLDGVSPARTPPMPTTPTEELTYDEQVAIAQGLGLGGGAAGALKAQAARAEGLMAQAAAGEAPPPLPPPVSPPGRTLGSATSSPVGRIAAAAAIALARQEVEPTHIGPDGQAMPPPPHLGEQRRSHSDLGPSFRTASLASTADLQQKRGMLGAVKKGFRSMFRRSSILQRRSRASEQQP